MFSNEDLLVPVSALQPCGDDVSFDACMDAIAAARRQDDPALEQGEWAMPLRTADWPLVASRCSELLRSRSKDLRLAVWLAEARAHTHGLRGLADGLGLLASLCERFWEQVHPLPEAGEHELRSGNLAWLLGRIPALVRDLPAVADPLAFLQDARYCLAALEQLQAAVDARLGADGPAFGPARDAVQKVVDDAVLKAPSFNTSAGAGSALASGEDSLAARTVCVADGAEGPGGWPTMPHSRAQALAQLRLVAEFFRRAEPHSPVAYLADKAAQWGELPLHEWLRTVVKDPAQIAQLDELLGAAPPG